MNRALVVDDSQFMRSVISDVLEKGGIEVVGQASDGERAVEAVRELEPDVVTMDLQMPRMDGIEAVEEIMEVRPTPILMLSAHTREGAEETFEALEKGAVDFLPKPGGEVSTSIADMKDRIVDKVETVAGVDVQRKGRSTPGGTTERTAEEYGEGNPTVIMGASTGGPSTIEGVLSALPRDADLRILIVQHMPADFTGSFARRLDSRSDYRVTEAEDGDSISAGEALLAPGDYHMAVARYDAGEVEVELNQDPPMHGVRPAIDVTMTTAARVVDDQLVGVVLTGMGKDGADGVRAIKGAGGRVIAQDEETSAVFGIPGRAIDTGCVDRVLPDSDIPDAVLRATAKRGVQNG